MGFRLPGEGAAELDGPGEDQDDGVVRLLVSRGEFTPGDVRRAQRHGGTHLVGRRRLVAWAAGLPLHELLDLPEGPAATGR